MLSEFVKENPSWKAYFDFCKANLGEYELYGGEGLYCLKTKNGEWYFFNERWKVIDTSDEIFE